MSRKCIVKNISEIGSVSAHKVSVSFISIFLYLCKENRRCQVLLRPTVAEHLLLLSWRGHRKQNIFHHAVSRACCVRAVVLYEAF